MAESNTVSAQEPQCGRFLWESGCRVPLGEGQASLGEALVTVHTCRLLLQPRRRLKVRSPTCNHCPREGGQSRVVAFSNVIFFNIIHNMTLLPGTLHCNYTMYTCVSRKNSK